MKKFIKIALLLACILVIGAFAVSSLYFGKYEGPDVRVNIPADTDDVPALLKEKLGYDFGSKVARLWAIQKGNVNTSHGSYLIAAGDNSINVSRRIAKGHQTPVRFTFNNVRTINELAAKVGETLEVDSARFLAVADTFLLGRGYNRDEQAAAFLPDTYEFYWSVQPEKLISKLYSATEAFWTSERKEKAATLGLTPVQVHILSSIVENETAKKDEMGKIARLYLNRINRDIPLQADPTVKFAMKKFDLRRITSEDLKYQSPYNTYLNNGLPPGPINIPEKQTIDYVLNAPQHDYIYMCAKSDFSGYHDFAATYDKHRINAARYHRALNKKGIKK